MAEGNGHQKVVELQAATPGQIALGAEILQHIKQMLNRRGMNLTEAVGVVETIRHDLMQMIAQAAEQAAKSAIQRAPAGYDKHLPPPPGGRS